MPCGICNSDSGCSEDRPILLQSRNVALLYAMLAVSAGSGGEGTSQLQLNNWSRADYLQLVTEKMTAFEREHKDLGIVLFGQVHALDFT